MLRALVSRFPSETLNCCLELWPEYESWRQKLSVQKTLTETTSREPQKKLHVTESQHPRLSSNPESRSQELWIHTSRSAELLQETRLHPDSTLLLPDDCLLHPSPDQTLIRHIPSSFTVSPSVTPKHDCVTVCVSSFIHLLSEHYLSPNTSEMLQV